MSDEKGTVYDAVVLAGGTGRRLGGVDKALVEVGGTTMLTRVLAAVADAALVVCVGPRRDTARPVTWCREQPPGGGPVAGLAAAVPHLSSEVVVVLAVDLPFVDAATVAGLVAAVDDHDGAVAVDEDGRAQPLLGAYRRERLDAVLAAAGAPAGLRVRDIMTELDLRHLTVGAAATDCDTADDLRVARARTESDWP